MNVIKNVVLNIADLLTFICNMSLSNGYFPQRIKIAQVVPIHMSGDKHIFANYKPTSLLQQFSEILEKFLWINLRHFMEKRYYFDR